MTTTLLHEQSRLEQSRLLLQDTISSFEMLDKVDSLEQDGRLGTVDVLEVRNDVGHVLEPVTDGVASFLLRCNMVCPLLFLRQELLVRFALRCDSSWSASASRGRSRGLRNSS